ncbi:MAG TPA: thiamine diphosphokinase [Anaerolineales bacterium]|jgi:thiamine pyrophosphokinase|nr:thiamine diphosphokinase [Anaerolineales bacterium]HQX15388.1 thiamine diphosphokinase [Anaerolineales bacterium]
MQRIIIFANGELPDLEQARAILRDDDYILCADGGARHALALDLIPNLVIGDMDSIDSAEWKRLEVKNIPIEFFPRDKNETDLELAINKAIEICEASPLGEHPNEIIIVAALGGRMDHTLANISLLAALRLSTFNLRLDDGIEQLLFCRAQAEIRGRSGDIVSLIPWGNPVHGVRTENLKWQLKEETLFPEKTRGISNEMTNNIARVKISSGLLLIVHTRKS